MKCCAFCTIATWIAHECAHCCPTPFCLLDPSTRFCSYLCSVPTTHLLAVHYRFKPDFFIVINSSTHYWFPVPVSPCACVCQVGLYGMDVYSMHSSAAAVVEALKRVDPVAAREVAARYRCIDK